MLVEPARVQANSWEDVADLSASVGVNLDGWQEIVLQSALGERADGQWAAKRVGFSIPRQNGKTQLMVARILAGALVFGENKIIVSAHQQDTAREAFHMLLEILDAEGNEWLRDRLDPRYGRGGIMNAINREAVKFKPVKGAKKGTLVQFKARSGSGSRGFSSDCLLLDEAQILSQRAWVSINSTMSARPNPQVWLLGTPPTPEDDGEVFASVRSTAIEGRSNAAAWAEWGVDVESEEFRRAQHLLASKEWTPEVEFLCWAGNPAWNERINHEVVRGEFETYPADRFALDRLGIWASESTATRAIPAKTWEDLGVEGKPDGKPTYAVAFSADDRQVSLAGAVVPGDVGHVELIDRTDDGLRGLGPLADWFVERGTDGPRWRGASRIILSGQSGAQVLKQLLIERHVPERRIHLVNTPQYLAACGMFDDSVKSGTVTHKKSGQEALEESVKVVDKDKRGGWTATTADGNETPVEAVSLALWGARTFKKSTGKAVFA